MSETKERSFRRRGLIALTGLLLVFLGACIASSMVNPGGITVSSEWVQNDRGLVVGYRSTVTNHTDKTTRVDCTIGMLAPASNDLLLESDEFITDPLPPGGSVTHEGSMTTLIRDRGTEFAIRDAPKSNCQELP